MVDTNLGWKTSGDKGYGHRALFNFTCMRRDSLAQDVVRETFGFNGVILKHFLVGGESLHHLDEATQRQGLFYLKTLVPGDDNIVHQSLSR